MKKFTPLLFACCLMAADFWQSKPFTEWNDKEVHKILTSSPWARAVSVELGAATPSALDSGAGGRDALGNRPPALDAPASPGVIGAPGGAPGGAPDGGATRSSATVDQMAENRSITLTIRWQSALPIKQALARARYGAEAATSPEARKLVEENSTYVIALSGLSPALAKANLAGNKDAVRRQTSLAVKGQPALEPSDVVINPQEKQVELLFVFPKTAAYTLDDKEVEFSTRLGALAVKYKFRLKDMLFNGKLDL